MDQPQLSTRFTLEAATRTPDGGGGVSLAWAPLGTLWGELRPASARERLSGERLSAHITHRITVRLSPDPSARPEADQRLRVGDRVFAIRGVAEAGTDRAFLTLWAEEGPFS